MSAGGDQSGTESLADLGGASDEPSDEPPAEGLEHTLYTMLREEPPETVIIGVGHRSTLNQFHTERLELLGESRWQVAALHRWSDPRPRIRAPHRSLR